MTNSGSIGDSVDSQRQVLASGKYLRLMQVDHWEYAERRNISGIVGIIAVTDDGRLLLTEQYRPPVDGRVIELPAGLAGDMAEAEDLTEAACRELEEETGYSAQQMTLICEGPPSAGTTSEVITLFLAEGLTRTGPGGGDRTEDIVVHEVPVGDVHGWLEGRRQQGIMVDLRIYVGLYFIALRGIAEEISPNGNVM